MTDKKKTGPKVQNLGEDDPTPALYIHCVNTYRAMSSEAKMLRDDEGNEIIIWEGMFTALITQKLNLSVPYYSSIRKALTEMGCIRQIRRGGGTSPSLWELITEPTEDLYEKKMPKRRVRVDRYAMQQEQIVTLGKRLDRLERAFQKVLEEEELDVQ